MNLLLRLLTVVGAVEAIVAAAVYLALTPWRHRGRVSWFLTLLGGSLAWMLALSVAGLFVDPPLWLWLPGLAGLDAALGLQLFLMLQRHHRRKN